MFRILGIEVNLRVNNFVGQIFARININHELVKNNWG